MDVSKFFGKLLLVFLAIGVGGWLTHSFATVIAVAIGLWAVYQIAKCL